MSTTSPERVADAQEMVWKLEAKYGPVLADVIDQVAVSHRLAAIEVPTAKAVRDAFAAAGVKRPSGAYSTELAGMLARRVRRRGLEDLIVDFRQHALAKLSRRFGGKTKGREDELRDYLLRLRNSGVAAHRPMLTWPMGLRSEATHGRDLISRRVTG